MHSKENISGQWPPVSKEEWLQQIRKDLRGDDFNTKLVSETDGIAVQPVYTNEDIPPSEIFGDDDFAEMELEEEEGQLLSWSVCREVVFHTHSDIYDLADTEKNNGAMCMHISGDIIALLQQLRLIRPAANHFMLHIDSDLADAELVTEYRNRISNLGGHQLLITSLEFDPIGYWMRNGSIRDQDASFNHLADLFFKLSPILHDCKIIHVDATISAEAGADSAQQLAHALAIAQEYISALIKRNVPFEEIFALFNFRFSIGSKYFFEIAKLKAFRRLWINLIKAYMPDTDYIPAPHIHAIVTQVNIAAEDSHTNVLRTTTEAMSAIVGGCEVLSVLPYDLHAQEKDENAERLALNVQHILRYESYFDAYHNVAEGAYFIESLTTELAENAWKYFGEITEAGGFIHCLQQGTIQEAIRSIREKIIADVHSEKTILIGVNKYAPADKHISETPQEKIRLEETQFEPVTSFYIRRKNN